MNPNSLSTDVYKMFGRHTQAGRLLYNIYGSKTTQQYNPKVPVSKSMKNIDPMERDAALRQKEIEKKKKKVYKSDVKISKPVVQKNPSSKFIGCRRKPQAAIVSETGDYERQKAPKQYVLASSRVDTISKMQDNMSLSGLNPEERKLMLQNEKKKENLKATKFKQREERLKKNLPSSTTSTKLDELNKLFDQVEKEIEERKEFLSDISSYGDDQLKLKIISEIAQRTNELKRIDKLIQELS